VDLINTAASEAGVSVEASFDMSRNGLLIRDNTSGTGSLAVTRADIASFAVDDLGLVKTVSDPETELIGNDVSRVRSDNLFTALIDLETALRADDERAVTTAAESLQNVASDVIRTHGVVGARARAMQDRIDQTDNAVASTRALLSDVQDLDFTEAITKFQQAQTALQANLLSGSQLLNISLLDFLR